jgi:hypothetical protein
MQVSKHSDDIRENIMTCEMTCIMTRAILLIFNQLFIIDSSTDYPHIKLMLILIIFSV